MAEALRGLRTDEQKEVAWNARVALFQSANPEVELSDKRTIPAAHAIELVGLSKPRVYKLASEGRLGTQGDDGWLFSFEELKDCALTDRPTGVHVRPSAKG